MFCNNCGAMLPNGSRYCTVCGSSLPQSGMDSQRPNLGEWKKNEAARQQTRTAMLVEPLKKIYTYKLIEMIIGAVVTFLTVITLASADNLDPEGAAAFLVFAGILGWGVIAINIMILLQYHTAGQYDYGFETVFKLYLTNIILGVLSIIVSSLLDSLIDIAQAIVSVACVYYLYHSLADVVRPVSRSTAAKWEGLFKFYIAYTILSIIGAIFTLIKAYGADSYGSALSALNAALWIMVISGVVSVIISIVELVYLNETTNKMQIAAAFPNGPERSM